ncbi:hypothetical protein WICPIJ_002613 [Wickerhamomyces pijperi]|uniref:Uncharacterized protein n=1 Tax=Wickerhamomyces pijperi TaxID=599730 RepID=A0A9P8TNT6_WICPI|nr:hypothetical protein WICPIJ_002613 [Wickerhamomyces pijperi]
MFPLAKTWTFNCVPGTSFKKYKLYCLVILQAVASSSTTSPLRKVRIIIIPSSPLSSFTDVTSESNFRSSRLESQAAKPSSVNL